MKRVLLFLLCSLQSAVIWAASIDINTATADDISRLLTGVGPSKAAAIVRYREQNGPFKKIEDLAKVKGIGQKTLETNRENISLVSDN